jgi:hypothetical protein
LKDTNHIYYTPSRQKPSAQTCGPDFLPGTFKNEGGKVNRKLEAKIRKEIRKRAFERADILRQKHQNLQMTEYTLDALQDVTGLPRPDLESIADDVRLSRQITHDDFFSIKNQILMTFGLAGLILILGGFMYII